MLVRRRISALIWDMSGLWNRSDGRNYREKPIVNARFLALYLVHKDAQNDYKTDINLKSGNPVSTYTWQLHWMGEGVPVRSEWGPLRSWLPGSEIICQKSFSVAKKSNFFGKQVLETMIIYTLGVSLFNYGRLFSHTVRNEIYYFYTI